MKKRSLPIVFLLIIMLLSGIVFSSYSYYDKVESVFKTQTDNLESKKSGEYLAKIRNNQVTGVINPDDLKRLQGEMEKVSNFRNTDEFEWKQIGPDNFGGTTRAILFDNKDSQANTVFAAGVTGGIWKSTNLGITWVKINEATSCLNVSCMVQTSNGDIYAGTGESFNSETFSGLQDLGYTSGFMGQGIFKSTDGENFTLVESTKPAFNNIQSDWAFVNELVTDLNNSTIFASTNTGLKFSMDGGQSWSTAKDTDGNELNLNSKEVNVGSNGLIVTEVNNLCYVSVNGDANQFVLRSTGDSISLPSTGVGRIEFAIAPSDPNIVYASVINLLGTTYNIYRSDDKGITWRIILPGTPTVNIFEGGGIYANALTVFPTDPNRILVGGVNLWQGYQLQETGFFDWLAVSESFSNPFFPTFIHGLHHTYVFRPGYQNDFFAGTDGGIFRGVFSSNEYTFSSLNRGFITTQFYSVGISGIEEYVLGGSQGNGAIMIKGDGNTAGEGVQLFPGNGGPSVVSIIDPAIIVISSENGFMVRSEDFGETYSATDQFPSGGIVNPNTFITPIALWESFNNQNSRDSVTYFAKEITPGGTMIMVRSKNKGQPFYYTTPADVTLNIGDSIRLKDIVSSRFFVATANNMYMTSDLNQFDKSPEWFNISNGEFGFIGTPSSVAYSSDANHLFVGTLDGRLYRISNLALAYNFERADVSSPTCIVALKEINLLVPGTEEKISQAITSISVDPNDPTKVMITLGNYGNEQYIMYSENSLDQFPSFISKQGNLPHMPVYSSVIEMTDPNIGIIGTEHGIYLTENIHESSPNWTPMLTGMARVPVFELKQQTVMQPNMTVTLVNGNDVTYVNYPGTNNCGTIYAATFGRGIFLNNFYHLVGTDDHFADQNSSNGNSLKFYPNPVARSNEATVEIEVSKNCTADMTIYDLSGKMISYKQTELNSGNNVIKVSTQFINKGTYLLKTVIGTSTFTNKFVVN